MAAQTSLRLSLIADFKEPASSRTWVSIPNPNSIPLIATATSDKTSRIYSLTDFKLHSILEGGHSRSIRSLAWKPMVKKTATITLVTASFDATIGVWRHSRDGEMVREGAEKAEKEEKDMESEMDEEPLETEYNREGEIKHPPRMINPKDLENGDGEDWEFAIVLEGHDSEVKHVAYSPSGQYLASCSRDKTIWIWEEIGEEGEDDFETVAVLQDHTGDVKYVAWRQNDGMGELLASASYDDTIRFWRDADGEGEWECIAVLEGHEGTVWALEWEPDVSISKFDANLHGQEEKKNKIRRLMSASADRTIRVWSPVPTPLPPHRPSYFNSGTPSTMRPGQDHEKWEVSATLPVIHEFAVYSISWSKKTGRVLSTGSDGRVVIYEERIKGRGSVGGEIEREWVIFGVLEASHGSWEVNHVTWSGRWDGGRRGEEEMVITSGDNGLVKAWSVEEVDEDLGSEK